MNLVKMCKTTQLKEVVESGEGLLDQYLRCEAMRLVRITMVSAAFYQIHPGS
jgi:hypothetical protein